MADIAVLLPGAGSSADFVRRAFAGPLRTAGYDLVAVAPEPGPDVVAGLYAALDAAADRHGPDLRLVGGVSLGSHVATRWAARRSPALPPPASPPGGDGPGRAGPDGAGPGGTSPGREGPAGGGPGGESPDPGHPNRGHPGGGGPDKGRPDRGRPDGGGVRLDGVLVVLPAWTGAPGPVGAVTAASADLVERVGTAAALERAAAGAGAVRWVADELAAAWPGYGPRLPASLRAAAASAGPDPAELAGLRVPVGLAAFVDDPLHPVTVAREWERVIPRAALVRLRLADPGADRSVLGTAALDALAIARAGTRDERKVDR